MQSSRSAGTILTGALKRKRISFPGYSLRAFARDLGLSPGFISKILKGQKPFPRQHIDKACQILEIDRAGRSLLEKICGLSVESNNSSSALPDVEYFQAPERDYWVLRNWYNLATLDLLATKGFVPDPEWIARRLGIRPDQASSALKELEYKGLIRLVDGTWIKTNKKLRFPTKETRKLIRDYHRQILTLTSRQLASQIDDHSYRMRSVNGLTVAANPAKIEQAKAILEDANYRAAQVLAEGDCTEVYSITSLMVPLTNLGRS